MTITTAQMRGARGLLNWSQSELSKRTGISTTSIGNIEAGNTQARENTLKVIRQAFENAGIEFIGTEGMRKRTNYIRTYEGREQFWDFYEDIYSTLVDNPGEVLVSNVDERLFVAPLTEDQVNTHVKRINELKDVTYRLLMKESDDFRISSKKYHYRGITDKHFQSVPFYVYSNKLAIIDFDTEPRVVVIQNSSVANAYRSQFESLWKLASPLNNSKETE